MSARRPTEYDRALRSAFGRVTNVSPGEARDAADVAEQAGRDELAAQLREYAADLEAMMDETPEPSAAQTADGERATPTPARTPKRSAPRKTSRRRSSTATGRAARDAVMGGDKQLAGAIRSTASIGWTIAGGIVLLVVVYLLVSKGDRSTGAIQQVAKLAQRAAFPAQLFPERYPETLKGGKKP